MSETTKRDLSSPQRITVSDVDKWRQFQQEQRRKARNRTLWLWAILLLGAAWIGGLIWMLMGVR